MEHDQVEAILRGLTLPPPSPELRKTVLEQAGKHLARPTGVSREPGTRILVLAAAALFLFLIAWFTLAPSKTVTPASQAKEDPSARGPLLDLIRRFASGDDTARPEILKAGAPAILLLRESRAQAPARIDDLLFDLKKQIAGPEGAKAALALEEKRSLEIPRGVEDPFWYAYDQLKAFQDLPLSHDPILLSRPLGDEGTSLDMVARSGREILDALCVKVGIDYGFFYGRILLSTPERLWPSVALPPAPALGKDEAERIRQWVEDLKNENPDVRTKAMERFKKLGRATLPILEVNAKRPETEIAARCRELIALFSLSEQGMFGRPGAERQNLKGEDARFYKSLKDQSASFKCAAVPMEGFLRLYLGPRGIPFDIAPTIKQVQVVTDAQNESLWLGLTVVCQGKGVDFMIRDGKLYFDTKGEIEKRVRDER